MRRTKKIAAVILAGALALTCLAGCSSDADKGFDPNSEIGVITREDGSGTRGAFIELFGIEEKNSAGEKFDRTTLSAVTTNSTSVMMTTVSGDLYAIGYISLGSLNQTVKALSIDGATATQENIKNGSYKVSRPFNIVLREDLSDAARDFTGFIMSSDGQAVIEDSGYIRVSDAGAYTAGGVSGKIVVSGSSSVTPVMEKLKEAYIALNPGVDIQVQQSDSSTGVADTIDGICDIGMASRELKSSELEKGVTSTTIALDGIAVIVNNQNPTDSMTSLEVKDVFTGQVKSWSDIAE